MIERIKGLVPVVGDSRDAETCKELRNILDNTDVNVDQLSSEIKQRLKPRRTLNMLSWVFSYFDRKADKAIEAAAITATKQLLAGSL